MGGTSTDVCLIAGGRAGRADERDGRRVSRSASRWSTSTRSARAAARSRGGTRAARCASGRRAQARAPGRPATAAAGSQPTVTDANLLLGRLPGAPPGRPRARPRRRGSAHGRHRPGRRGGHRQRRDAPRAARRLGRAGARPAGFALVAFGGAGPLHACALAEELGAPRCSSPTTAGVLSAVGLVASDERRDHVRSYPLPSPRRRRASRRRRGEPSLPRPVLRAMGRSGAGARRALPPRARGALRVRRPRGPRRAGAVRCARPIVARAGLELRAAEHRRVSSGPELVVLDGATCWVPTAGRGRRTRYGTLVLERIP